MCVCVCVCVCVRVCVCIRLHTRDTRRRSRPARRRGRGAPPNMPSLSHATHAIHKSQPTSSAALRLASSSSAALSGCRCVDAPQPMAPSSVHSARQAARLSPARAAGGAGARAQPRLVARPSPLRLRGTRRSLDAGETAPRGCERAGPRPGAYNICMYACAAAKPRAVVAWRALAVASPRTGGCQCQQVEGQGRGAERARGGLPLVLRAFLAAGAPASCFPTARNPLPMTWGFLFFPRSRPRIFFCLLPGINIIIISAVGCASMFPGFMTFMATLLPRRRMGRCVMRTSVMCSLTVNYTSLVTRH